jgi:hypothetical protein
MDELLKEGFLAETAKADLNKLLAALAGSS